MPPFSPQNVNVKNWNDRIRASDDAPQSPQRQVVCVHVIVSANGEYLLSEDTTPKHHQDYVATQSFLGPVNSSPMFTTGNPSWRHRFFRFARAPVHGCQCKQCVTDAIDRSGLWSGLLETNLLLWSNDVGQCHHFFIFLDISPQNSIQIRLSWLTKRRDCLS